MAAIYTIQDRTGITLTNVSNTAIEVYDEGTAYRFGPNESKSVSGDIAIKLNAQNGSLKLPDTTTEGNLFGKEKPGSGELSAQEV